MSNDPALDSGTNPKALDDGDDQAKLQSGDDLAKKALAEASGSGTSSTTTNSISEAEASDELAETLFSLQAIIERNAEELDRLKQELKEHRNSLRNVFDNDTKLAEAKAEADTFSEQVKNRKVQLTNDPTVVQLKAKIGDVNERKKEIEEALSNHLVNYYQMTNSTSFDTSDGDQREFQIKASVKGRKKS